MTIPSALDMSTVPGWPSDEGFDVTRVLFNFAASVLNALPRRDTDRGVKQAERLLANAALRLQWADTGYRLSVSKTERPPRTTSGAWEPTPPERPLVACGWPGCRERVRPGPLAGIVRPRQRSNPARGDPVGGVRGLGRGF
jgi:hypothetical protein